MTEKEINENDHDDIILLNNANPKDEDINLNNSYIKRLIIISIPLTLICIIIIGIIIAIYYIHKYNKKEKSEQLEVFKKYKKLGILKENKIEIIYKAKNRLTGELVTIKEIPLMNIENMQFQEEIEKEIKFMDIFNNSKNSINIYDIYKLNSTLFIVMDLCDGDLSNYLEKSENGFSIYEIKVIFNQLNNILYEIRSKDMIYNNINLENIFIKFKSNKKEFDVKLSNYSLTKFIPSKKDFINLNNNIFGIKPYNNNTIKYEEKYDLLKIGILIYRMIFKVKAENYREYYENIYNYVKDKDLRNLLKGLIIDDFNKRIDWDDYFKHPFFKIDKIDFNKIKNIVKK